MEYSYRYFEQIADFLKTKIDYTPQIAIILGSCLGPFAEQIENPVVVDYKDIPNFLVSTVASHAGKMIFGTICGRKVVCMSGRFHNYEGYSFEQLVIPIRVFKLLGVETTILTNAAGGINVDYRPGDVMILSDHIKMNGDSPLRGRNVPEFGPRFFSTVDMYTPRLREIAKHCATTSELTVHEGVYYFYSGPQFETPAEIRAFRALGADAVGMSTVTEALTAAHCNMPILALAVITNMAAGVMDVPFTSQEVNETAKSISLQFSEYVKSIIREL